MNVSRESRVDGKKGKGPEAFSGVPLRSGKSMISRFFFLDPMDSEPSDIIKPPPPSDKFLSSPMERPYVTVVKEKEEGCKSALKDF